MTDLVKKYPSPSGFAEKIAFEYAQKTTNAHKKEAGQFFTSKQIADYMGSWGSSKSDKVSILDPGCGTAILSSALIESLVNKSPLLKAVKLTLFETDEALIPELQKVTRFLSKWLSERGVDLTTRICQSDFILENSSVFRTGSLFVTSEIECYDYIISNPPYFKISKSDKRAVVAKDLVHGQPNIYSLFMGVSAKLLKPDGELIFITPRSFAAGNYFKAFRQVFFKDVSLAAIHIFESRNKMFKNDNVLQENIIIKATKQINTQIKITTSECEQGLTSPTERFFDTEALIDFKSEDKVLFIPSNENEEKAIKLFKSWKNALTDYNINISTGPVVAFRCKQFLKEDGEINTSYAPLIWLHNIKEMELVYPLKKGGKEGLIAISEESQKVLLRNKNYILIRRFSSKDDKSRLVCCPYFASSFDSEMIGLENHINYIHRPGGELSENEIWGISALYNSTLFDTYFRTFNGNTQVGATELKQIKMPLLEDIIRIGSKVKKLKIPNKQTIDKIIHEILNSTTHVENHRSTGDFKSIGVA
ncbi:Eco57I restriction-modification methylase domain-containing protein [Mangrovibacterium marinum]|uniref:Eco57I restriction-modification methylase domain-containing protein n=1 Tax=Mangrovibacterium marinum TaxID=1639118 RepID=UPI002A18B24F|nr:Eco57I restriction-modification methylase domain-containing protein [Mangrovibacterium marinum]